MLHTLGKYFPECYKRCLGVGRCFCCDGGISSYALELGPCVGVELQLSAWYQVCCVLPFGLLGPMLHSHPPGDLDGDLMVWYRVARTTLLIDPLPEVYFTAATVTSPVASLTAMAPHSVGLPFASNLQPYAPAFFAAHCPAFRPTM